jgi:hypothetical protein
VSIVEISSTVRPAECQPHLLPGLPPARRLKPL